MATTPTPTPGNPNPTANPPAPPAAKPKTVKVILLCDHVFLPVDLTLEDWKDVETQRYEGKGADGKRAKLTVSRKLGEALERHKQAEILD